MSLKECRLGVIGCGLRVAGDLLKQLQKFDMNVKLVAVCDTDNEYAVKRLQEFKINYDGTVFYTDADEMMDKENLDGIIVGTRCDLHTHFAIKVMKRGIPLFVEKPLATNFEDLMALKKAWEQYKGPVTVSLPLRVTHLVRLAKKIIDSGEIGEVQHVQAYNNVSYGDVYYQSWYRDESTTNGLFVQKSIHDLDYINYLVGRKPVKICAMKSKQIFKGDKPAGLECKDCDEYYTCMQSPFVMTKIRNHPLVNNQWCSFAVDTGNEDSGSAIIRYDNGMHAVYSQNFFCRNGAGKRGARLFGYKGTLEFDWVTNTLTVYDHYYNKKAIHQFAHDEGGHGGGDSSLTLNFIYMMRGEEPPIVPFDDALTANLLSLLAKRSAETDEFQTVDWGLLE